VLAEYAGVLLALAVCRCIPILPLPPKLDGRDTEGVLEGRLIELDGLEDELPNLASAVAVTPSIHNIKINIIKFFMFSPYFKANELTIIRGSEYTGEVLVPFGSLQITHVPSADDGENNPFGSA
jgi:hypothetical protein